RRGEPPQPRAGPVGAPGPGPQRRAALAAVLQLSGQYPERQPGHFVLAVPRDRRPGNRPGAGLDAATGADRADPRLCARQRAWGLRLLAAWQPGRYGLPAALDPDRLVSPVLRGHGRRLLPGLPAWLVPDHPGLRPQ